MNLVGKFREGGTVRGEGLFGSYFTDKPFPIDCDLLLLGKKIVITLITRGWGKIIP